MRISLEEGGKTPEYSTYGSAAYDCFMNEPYVVIPPGCHRKISLGFFPEIPTGYCGILTHRSGMNSRQGAWAYGTIDDDYRGLVSVTIFNLDPSREISMDHGDRIAQMRVVEKASFGNLQVVDTLTKTKRGEGGHGSTGTR